MNKREKIQRVKRMPYPDIIISKEQFRKLLKTNQNPLHHEIDLKKLIRYEWFFDEKFLRELFASKRFNHFSILKRLPKSVINGKKYKKLIEENCLDECVGYVSKDSKNDLEFGLKFLDRCRKDPRSYGHNHLNLFTYDIEKFSKEVFLDDAFIKKQIKNNILLLESQIEHLFTIARKPISVNRTVQLNNKKFEVNKHRGLLLKAFKKSLVYSHYMKKVFSSADIELIISFLEGIKGHNKITLALGHLKDLSKSATNSLRVVKLILDNLSSHDQKYLCRKENFHILKKHFSNPNIHLSIITKHPEVLTEIPIDFYPHLDFKKITLSKKTKKSVSDFIKKNSDSKDLFQTAHLLAQVNSAPEEICNSKLAASLKANDFLYDDIDEHLKKQKAIPGENVRYGYHLNKKFLLNLQEQFYQVDGHIRTNEKFLESYLKVLKKIISKKNDFLYFGISDFTKKFTPIFIEMLLTNIPKIRIQILSIYLNPRASFLWQSDNFFARPNDNPLKPFFKKNKRKKIRCLKNYILNKYHHQAAYKKVLMIDNEDSGQYYSGLNWDAQEWLIDHGMFPIFVKLFWDSGTKTSRLKLPRYYSSSRGKWMTELTNEILKNRSLDFREKREILLTLIKEIGGWIDGPEIISDILKNYPDLHMDPKIFAQLLISGVIDKKKILSWDNYRDFSHRLNQKYIRQKYYEKNFFKNDFFIEKFSPKAKSLKHLSFQILRKESGFKILKKILGFYEYGELSDTNEKKDQLKIFFSFFKKSKTTPWIFDQDVTDFLLGINPSMANFFPLDSFLELNLKNLGPITRNAIYRNFLARAKKNQTDLFSRSLMKQKLLKA